MGQVYNLDNYRVRPYRKPVPVPSVIVPPDGHMLVLVVTAICTAICIGRYFAR